MAWFKVDDKLWAHPKIMALPLSALGLWVKAGSYCAAYETDGALDRHMVGTFGAQKRDSDRLVDAGLWIETETGFVFHDWGKYQPTKAQLEAERSATRERVNRFRNAKRNGVGNGVTNGGGNGVSTPAPTRPDPTRPNKKPPTPLPGGTPRGPHDLPGDWEPKPAHYDLARQSGHQINVRFEADQMTAWARDKGRRSKDWDARFSNWLRKEIKDRGGPKQPTLTAVQSPAIPYPPGMPVAERTAWETEYSRARRAGYTTGESADMADRAFNITRKEQAHG